MSSSRVAPTIGFCLLALVVAFPGVARADKPAAFIKQAGLQMIAAAHSRSHATLASVIRRYSDLPDIGLFSLGNYRKQLPSSRRNSSRAGFPIAIARSP